MKYIHSDFLGENLRLRLLPLTAEQAYNKLVCLMECEKRRDTKANQFYVAPLSKRRERIVKMYWAFRKMEVAE